MGNEIITTHQRATVTLKTHDSLDGIYPSAIRKGITADGLYDSVLAHNHGEDGSTVSCVPAVLFRKGNKNTIVLVGIGEGAKYLMSKPIPVGEKVRMVNLEGKAIVTTIEGGSITRNIDHIRVGGFHVFETRSPIIVAKSGSKMMGMILEADEKTQSKLISTCIARQIRNQIAMLESIPVRKTPRIRVVFDGKPRIRVAKLKDKVDGISVKGEFGCNAYYSGGRFGIGIGRSTTTGYGIIQEVRG